MSLYSGQRVPEATTTIPGEKYAMRRVTLCLLLLGGTSAMVPATAETVGTTTLPDPAPSWFISQGGDASHLWDATDGEMLGLISHTGFTTATVTLPSRKEAYLVNSYYSRAVTGTRSDVLTILDLNTLATKAEVDLPPKAAALRIRQHIALLGDERHVVLFNMTPAMSVSVVDVVQRKFVGEISTAGCAIIMPVEARGFLMLCGDGTLQLIRLDENGHEAERLRSKRFFDVEKDPIFDRVVYDGAGWILISQEGLVRQVGVEGKRITVSDAWSMLNDEDKAAGNTQEQWRPGGEQPFTLHRGTHLLYSLMHKGKVDTPDADGTELWVFDTDRRKRVARLVLPVETKGILASQEPTPHLYLRDKDNKLHIYDAHRLKLLRTIEKPGAVGGLLQTLTPND